MLLQPTLIVIMFLQPLYKLVDTRGLGFVSAVNDRLKLQHLANLRNQITQHSPHSNCFHASHVLRQHAQSTLFALFGQIFSLLDSIQTTFQKHRETSSYNQCIFDCTSLLLVWLQHRRWVSSYRLRQLLLCRRRHVVVHRNNDLAQIQCLLNLTKHPVPW